MAEVTWTFPAIRPRISRTQAFKPTPQRGPPIHIETHGYVLRSLRSADATSDLLEIINSKTLQTGLNIDLKDFDTPSLIEFISRFDDKHNYFVGIFKNGLIKGFYTVDVNLTHRVGVITAGISEAASREDRVYWATIEAFIEHLFVYRDLEKISARIFANNRAMLFNFMNAKLFQHEATLRKECIALDGTRQDVIVFSALKGESNPDGLDYTP